MTKVLSIDIGASSGRLVMIEYNKNSGFKFDEVYRFSNGMKNINNSLKWDFNDIISHIYLGILKALKTYPDIKSIGVDTWGVDYGRLDSEGNLIDMPFGYRDSRCDLAAKKLLSKVNYEDIYKISGIQYLNFNTLFQLYDDKLNKREFNNILLIPDLINYYLTGNKFIELTNLSTTSLYNPLTHKIDESLLNLIGVNKEVFPNIIYPSNKVGTLKDDLVKDFSYPKIDVISVGSHDTASAVASLNLNENVAFLSSGTWSLLGIELKEPLINLDGYKANFTNEIGLESKIRYLKNIMGLFIIQEIKKDLEINNPNISFGYLHHEATLIKSNDIYIDIDDEYFSKPGNMLNKFFAYLKKTNQYKDDLSIGQIVRSIYESMAFKYLEEFDYLKKITNKDVNKLLIVGGGSNASLLNQLIANVLDVTVEIGLSEGTTYGNALAQLIYWKEFKDLAEAREALSSSYKKEIYYPEDVNNFKNKYKIYKRKVKSDYESN